jgi:uncharacterized protein (DUF1501 family)
MNRLEGVMPASEEVRFAPIRAVSIGSLLPTIFKGRNSVATIASGATAARPTILDRQNVRNAFEAIYSDDPRMGSMFANYVAARTEVVAAIQQADPEMMAADNGALSAYAFAGDAARLGALMRRDLRMQLGFLAVSGWDTHANQGGVSGQLADLLSRFAKGMSALARSLGPAYAETTIVVISEFGRTVAQNGNAGTDHGHGNLMWLMGGPIAGAKVHGEWPGLDDAALYEGRDLAVVTDYRTVLAQICERHLRLSETELSEVFPDMPRQAKSIQLIKALNRHRLMRPADAMFIARDAAEPARGDCGVRCEATRAGDPFRMAVSPYWWIDQLWDEHQRHPVLTASKSSRAPNLRKRRCCRK